MQSALGALIPYTDTKAAKSEEKKLLLKHKLQVKYHLRPWNVKLLAIWMLKQKHRDALQHTHKGNKKPPTIRFSPLSSSKGCKRLLWRVWKALLSIPTPLLVVELQSSQWQNLHLTTERLFVPIPRRERGNCCLPYPSRSPTCHVHHRKASILSPLATTEEPRWRTETHQETLLLSSIRAAALFLHCFRFRSRV